MSLWSFLIATSNVKKDPRAWKHHKRRTAADNIITKPKRNEGVRAARASRDVLVEPGQSVER